MVTGQKEEKKEKENEEKKGDSCTWTDGPTRQLKVVQDVLADLKRKTVSVDLRYAGLASFVPTLSFRPSFCGVEVVHRFVTVSDFQGRCFET